MILFKKATDLRNYLDKQRKQGKKYGFVPTMGALHAGHVSLINNSKKANELTVCSIFVNPTQFNDPKDFEKYPVTLEKDIAMLETAGCDILFLPTVVEMYPNGTQASSHYDLGYLETILEGHYRPGHFQGVCMIVHRLLDIVKPDNLYIGQKDYQQCMVIKKLIELTGMKELINLNISPTLREAGGLAMSSRNMRLSEQEKIKATAINKALISIKEQLKKGELTFLKKKAASSLSEKGFKVDYVEIADAGNLSIVNKWNGKQKLVTLAAVHLNDVRLIDNILLN
ncbi:MAG TPA: pantoate--beta-alanine ligase [Chitinophagaceae bacterium]|nr:pantoate--beta-alanine ligase [Chitinophagaceae bacterium]